MALAATSAKKRQIMQLLLLLFFEGRATKPKRKQIGTFCFNYTATSG